MLRRILIRSTLFLALAGIVSCSVTPAKEEIIKRMAMSKKELDKIQQLHYGWYVQAVSALLGAIGKEHYMKMDRNNRRAFVACLDNIDKEHDLQSGAKCLVKAFDKQLVKSFPCALHRPYYDFVDVDLKHRGSQTKKKLMRKAVKDFAKAKAAQLLKQHFTKKSEDLSRTKFISPKRRITYKRSRSEMLPRRNQKLKSILQKRHRRVRRNVLSLYRNKEAIEEAKRADNMDSPYRPINMQSTPPLLSRQKSPVRV
ncbi:unnamed protein product [Heligmosomoides polygyrus]|uniref:Anti-lipopolysaccharide factor n=1 Tax=Heligmosomoides polygyrus TaxID=6339 RepID=A0A3P7U890_HELPZ|nr:unnamed protein product [Heligmosomoides polygyrus]